MPLAERPGPPRKRPARPARPAEPAEPADSAAAVAPPASGTGAAPPPRDQAPPRPSDRPPSDEVAESIAEVVRSAIGVGVAVAKAFAGATAGKHPVAPPSTAAGPVDQLIHYSVAAVGGIARQVVSGAGQVAGAATGPVRSAAPAATEPSPPALPSVRAGASLRIPLSIENPGPDPMNEMRMLCRDVVALNGPPVEAPPWVRLAPVTLSIAPHDFEKLTVTVDTGSSTTPGAYEAVIGAENLAFEMRLHFEVLPAAS